jgi:signal transduction histidine kinase
MRDEFLAAAAHDLKAPLTAIKSMAQLLHRGVIRTGTVDTERLVERLTNINATATQMSVQIDDLLDLTRLEMGQPLELQRDSTDLVALARQAAAEHQQATERHRIRVEAAVPEIVGRWDAMRLARVLNNLLGNAVKYSPEGGEVTLTVGQENGDAGAWAVVTVQDQGIGIPAADLPRIFGRFQRAGNAVGRIGGTGVGLASARQIVEQHGGTITVTSQEGAGSAFTIRLPLDHDE